MLAKWRVGLGRVVQLGQRDPAGEELGLGAVGAGGQAVVGHGLVGGARSCRCGSAALHQRAALGPDAVGGRRRGRRGGLGKLASRPAAMLSRPRRRR